jgi:O-antigen ligase
VLSRLHPAWFPRDPRPAFGQTTSRLAYPLGYWNGLGAFLAMGVPLLFAAAAGTRRIALQALALSAIPVVLLGIFLANSRGGAIALGVAVGAFILLTADRLAALARFAVVGLGAWILIAYADHHPIVRQGVDTLAARQAGNRMIVVMVLVCAGVAMLGVAIGLAARHAERPTWLVPSRRQGTTLVASIVAVLIVAGLAAGVPDRLDRAWQDFKRPVPVAQTVTGTDLFSRLSSATGNSRYQYWVQAVKAVRTDPLTGTGAGTFGLWWTAHATAAGHITDAHSLYLQTLAETGIVGLVLIGGLLLCLLLAGIWRTVRAPDRLRLPLAGATAAVAAFATSAAYDWVWQLGAIAALALILGAVCVSGTTRAGAAGDAVALPARSVGRRRRSGPAALVPRAALVVLALAALLAVALPMAAARDLAQSRAAVARGDLRSALGDANAAHRVQPYASTPELQRALILEQAGQLQAAREAAVGAVSRDGSNWQPRVILARIEAELGLRSEALATFDRARQLDPLGQIFHP